MFVKYKSLENNITLYKYFTIFSDTILVWSILIPFMKMNNLSFFHIMLFYSSMEIMTFILEIPTGMISDYFGHRIVIIIGSVFKSLAFLLLIFCNHYYFLILSCILFSLSDSLLSGSTTAILYETLISLKREDEYSNILRDVKSKSMYIMSICILFSGFIFNINIYLPFLITSLMIFISFIISLFYSKSKISDIDRSYNYKKYLTDVRKCIYDIRNLGFLIFTICTFTIIYSNMNFFSQEFLLTLNINYNYYGIIFFISNIISALIWKHGDLFENLFKNNTFVFSSLYLSLCFFIMFKFMIYYGAILAIPMMRISSAITLPLIDVKINNIIVTKNRATILSIINALISLLSFIIDPIIGKLIDVYSIFIVLKIIALVLLLFSFYLYLIRNKLYTIKKV